MRPKYYLAAALKNQGRRSYALKNDALTLTESAAHGGSRHEAKAFRHNSPGSFLPKKV